MHIYFVRIAVLQYFFVDIDWDCVGNGPPRPLYLHRLEIVVLSASAVLITGSEDFDGALMSY